MLLSQLMLIEHNLTVLSNHSCVVSLVFPFVAVSLHLRTLSDGLRGERGTPKRDLERCGAHLSGLMSAFETRGGSQVCTGSVFGFALWYFVLNKNILQFCHLLDLSKS